MPDPIRVLHMLPDLKVGGGQYLLLRHLAGMDPAAVENHVCYVRPIPEMAPEYERAGIATHGLGLGSPLALAGALRRLIRLARRLRINVIHTNNTGSDRILGQMAALMLGLPVVNSLHSEYSALHWAGGPRQWPKRLVQHAVYRVGLWLGRRTVRHVVPVSRGVRVSWAPCLARQGIGDDRITVVYPGLAESRFEERTAAQLAALRTSLGIGGASPILLNVGRLTRGKGQRHLISIMGDVRARHPQAVLLLIGDGEDRSMLEAMIAERELGNSVRLLGTRDDVADLLWLADLFVFPSYSEGFPLSVLEAMAAQRPVVAFAIPAFDELITEGRGAVLVPLRDERALREATLALLADERRRREIGGTGRELVSPFTQGASSAALQGVYLRVMGRDGAAAVWPVVVGVAP